MGDSSSTRVENTQAVPCQVFTVSSPPHSPPPVSGMAFELQDLTLTNSWHTGICDFQNTSKVDGGDTVVQ